MFHRHDYELICKTQSHQIPVSLIKEADASEHMIERLVLGTTTVLLKCKKCNKILKKEMLGYETQIADK